MTQKRTDIQIQHDRLQVSQMYLRGITQHEIAEKLTAARRKITLPGDEFTPVTVAMVASDIAAIREEWRALRLWNMDDLIARELARLDQVEREAWSAWEESRKEYKETVQNVRPDPHNDDRPRPVGGMITTRPGGGNDRFLNIVLECVEKRAKLLGLYAAQKHDVTVSAQVVGVGRVTNIHELDDRELGAELKRLELMSRGQSEILDEVEPAGGPSGVIDGEILASE